MPPPAAPAVAVVAELSATVALVIVAPSVAYTPPPGLDPEEFPDTVLSVSVSEPCSARSPPPPRPSPAGPTAVLPDTAVRATVSGPNPQKMPPPPLPPRAPPQVLPETTLSVTETELTAALPPR